MSTFLYALQQHQHTSKACSSSSSKALACQELEAEDSRCTRTNHQHQLQPSSSCLASCRWYSCCAAATVLHLVFRLLAEYYSREDYSLDKELIDRMKL
jgi:hypothetical protein